MQELLRNLSDLEERLAKLEVQEPNRIAALVSNDVDQSIATGTTVTLGFNTEFFDYGELHHTGTNNSRLTATVGGIYHVTAFAAFTSNSSSWRSVSITKNGSVQVTNTVPAASGISTRMTLSTILELSEGDYVELAASHGHSSALNVFSSVRFGMALL